MRLGAAAGVLEMSPGGGVRADEVAVLTLAREGDGAAFGELVDGYRAGLRAHCYRILGSVQDAEDALQEALLRAWRGLAGFEGRSSVRCWLYAIATRAALDMTARRSRRELPVDFSGAAAQGADLDPPRGDLLWLEPFPDQWLADEAGATPEARYEQRESVELAFVVALQHLPPLPRAVLILREVVGLSTAEISSQLRTSPQSVNSALQRARAALHSRLPAQSQQSTLRALGDQRTRAIAGQYADAIEQGDADSLVSMLTEDATWSMPPCPTWFCGHQAIRGFLVRYPLTHPWKHHPARANGQLAVGGYMPGPGHGCYVPAVLDVLTLDGGQIAAVTAFLTAETLRYMPAATPRPPHAGSWVAGADLFPRFGLPAWLP